MGRVSVLFGPAAHRPADPPTPEVIADLHLDRLRAAIFPDGGDAEFAQVFDAPLREPDAVYFRHAVFADLARDDIAHCVKTFTDRMLRVTDLSRRAAGAQHCRQRERWHLDAAHEYCRAVAGLRSELAAAVPESTALQQLLSYLDTYTGGEKFQSLAGITSALISEITSQRYCVHIDGWQVRVERFAGQPDLGATVTATFHRFRDDRPRPPALEVPPPADLNHIDEQVLDCVARLFPDTVGKVGEFFRQ
ncbi:hypothetical protein ACIBQ0_10220 [Nocardia nova]|uniref:hypothetical protein n=1 Tax=Nocardia nova TaxID=37330 RepID=UPI0037AFAC46